MCIEECSNCCRRRNQYLINTHGPNSMYNITFVAHTNNDIMNRCFKYVIGKNNPDNAKDILLCSECSRYSTSENCDKN